MADIDLDKFRLRRFVEKLDEMGEVHHHDEPIDLSDLSSAYEISDKALLFKQAGPEKLELVANVNGSRKRVAAALGVSEEESLAEYQRRLANPQPVVEIPNDEAPCRQVVLTGDDIDLTKLPFHVQHRFDGSAYLSSGIDYTVDPDTGITNVGARRLSLRNKTTAGTNVTAPSDLKRIYQGCVARGEKLPINFAIGGHPLDFLAAGMRVPADEITLVGTLRGEPVPLVKGLTNDVRVPADAEMILEGYFDEQGYIEPDGPYGEYVGYYGPMHLDPVYHVTAITMREDVLHQTLLHGAGYNLQRCDSSNLLSVRGENQVYTVLKNVNIQVVDVYIPPASAEGQHVRVSIKQQRPGQARSAITALFGAMFGAKHIFVVDEDINIRDEHHWEWAMVSRFQADKDIMVMNGMAGMPMDPSLDHGIFGAKAGFDMTLPMHRRHELALTPSVAPKLTGTARYQTVEQALEESGPLFFSDVMDVLGSRDGREIALQLDELRAEGKLMRDSDGRYLLGEAPKGSTGLYGPQKEDPNRFTGTSR
jgi:2,5-furandicarboxylate decarboxylase 1